MLMYVTPTYFITATTRDGVDACTFLMGGVNSLRDSNVFYSGDHDGGSDSTKKFRSILRYHGSRKD